MKLGVDKTALVRVRAGISYALTEAMDEGHCGLPTDDLVPLAGQLLKVPQDLIRTALDLELADGTVVANRVGDRLCVFLTGLYRAERGIADRLLQLRNGKLPWPWIDPDKAIPWIEQRTGLVFAESQRSAVVLALTSKILVITGGQADNNRRHRLSGWQPVGNWVASGANFPASLLPAGVIPTTSRESRRTVCVGKWPRSQAERDPAYRRTAETIPRGGGSFFATAADAPANQSFPLNGGLGNNPTDRDAYVRYNLNR
jgi:hypothetical protein